MLSINRNRDRGSDAGLKSLSADRRSPPAAADRESAAAVPSPFREVKRLPSIGVLTFHRCINYGSYWQARCLVDGLRALGADAVLLDHRSERIDRAEWRCALQPLLPERSSPQHRALYAAKTRKFFDAFARLPMSPPFALGEPDTVPDCDLVVVGSDEVWNLKHPWYGGSALFYGQGLQSNRLASYAASFGNSTFAEDRDRPWIDYLRDFDHIAVRDLNSRRIVQDMLGEAPDLVLDPCLQFPGSITAIEAHAPDQPFVAVYGHSFPAWFKTAIRHWADTKVLPLVSIGYGNDWVDHQWIDAGPADFARFMASATAVATNFFHGCVFSLVNGKPFSTVLSSYRSNKISDLMATVGAEDHLAGEATAAEDYDLMLGRPPDLAIAARISALRHSSAVYLNHVLR
jgi:hypothetical protein